MFKQIVDLQGSQGSGFALQALVRDKLLQVQTPIARVSAIIVAMQNVRDYDHQIEIAEEHVGEHFEFRRAE